MKIAVIGGGGKISSAVIYEMLDTVKDVPLSFALYGRNDKKISDTLTISKRFAGENAAVYREKELDDALRGADVVFYCATYGCEDCGNYRSMGIANGAYIMSIGEKMTSLCPDAHLAVLTNPPDIPLAAVKMRFGIDKLIGLCNAPIFNRRVTASFLGCGEDDIVMHEIGVNHEYWFYEITKDGEDIYDLLREKMVKEYSTDKIRSETKGYLGEFHKDFPEWSLGFTNNVKLMELCGYMSGPVGGSNRYKGLPIVLKDMWAIASRPTAQDFEELLDPSLTNDQIKKKAARCAAGIPTYAARVLTSLARNDGKEHHVLALNNGALPGYPDDVLLQMSCGISRDGIRRPDLSKIDEYIMGVLSSRITQNHLMARALADGNEMLMRRALLCYPERVECHEVEDFLKDHKSVEPFIQLD